MRATITGAALESIGRKYPSGDPYTQVRLLTGKSDVVSVNFVPGRYEGDLPREGEVVEVTIDIRAFVGKTGSPGLGVDAVEVKPAPDSVLV